MPIDRFSWGKQVFSKRIKDRKKRGKTGYGDISGSAEGFIGD